MLAPPASGTTPLYKLLPATFLASVSGGAFWSAIFFVTAHAFAFSSARNLALASVMGVAYIGGALASGPVTRKLAHWASVRAVMIGALWTWGAFACVPLLLAPTWEPSLWIAALGGSVTSALVWPMMESYLTAGRHGTAMRQAMGRYNLTWTSSVAVPLLLMPLVARWNVLACLGLSAVFNLVSGLIVTTFAAHPAHHDETSSQQSLGREYPYLARATTWLLPCSYIICSALSPVLPSVLRDLGMAATAAPVWASTWMVARFCTLVVLWRSSFWHGRWPPLLVGAGALFAGAAVALLAPWPWLCVCGLAAFGCGMGVLYYTSLYYSMSVGQAQVDAGGKFEALVGVGYVVGPVLGLVSYSNPQSISPMTAMMVMGALTAMGSSVMPMRAYRAAVSTRRREP